MKQCFLTKIDRLAIPVWKLYITTTYSEIFMVAYYHCTAVGAIWNLSKFTGSTGKFLYSIFLEIRSVLGVNFFSAFNTSTGASKYIKIVKIHYPPNFQNFPKLCSSFNNLDNLLSQIGTSKLVNTNEVDEVGSNRGGERKEWKLL